MAGKSSRSRSSSTASWPQWGQRLALLLLLVAPFVYLDALKEPFRVPKLLISESLALSSLLVLSLSLWSKARVEPLPLIRHPAILLCLPVLVVAAVSLVTSPHAAHVGQALQALTIGCVTLVGWSLALPRPRELLSWLLLPAAGLSILGILQFSGLYQPFEVISRQERYELTSLAGSVGDLAAYLVLPTLVAQACLVDLWPKRARSRWKIGAITCTLALSLTILALSQTITAIIGLVTASLLFWLRILSARRWLLILGGLTLGAALSLSLVTPLQKRAEQKIQQAARGEVNTLLSGRLDGWRAAIRMFTSQPWTGVGLGSYAAEFNNTKLELMEEGVRFWSGHGRRTTFANAHNEYLEIAAEMGLPGVLVLLVALGFLGERLVRVWRTAPASSAGLACGGVAGLAVLALTGFPFRLALLAYPSIALLAWVSSRELLPEPGA